MFLLWGIFIFTLFEGLRSCPSLYSKMEDGTCLASLQEYDIEKHESACRDFMNGGVPFVRRMSDKLWDEFQKYMKQTYDTTGLKSMYIGMTKDGGLGSKKWNFNNGKGSVEEGDYPFWAEKPGSNDCGSLSKVENFKVRPMSCSEENIALCEKREKPCYEQAMFYGEFYGRCLSSSNQKSSYAVVGYSCLGDAYIMPIVDEEDRKAAAAALYTTLTGAYNGLRRIDGEWRYGTGEIETERFDKNNLGDEECGFWGLQADGTVTMFTTSCKGRARLLCEFIVPFSKLDALMLLK